VPSLGLEGEKDSRHPVGALVPDETSAVVPYAVLMQATIDRRRVALRHMNVVKAERRWRRVAESGVRLMRIILAESVAVEKNVRAGGLSDMKNRLETMNQRIAGFALRGQDAHQARIEEVAALEIEGAG
jgi:hypothetical protein